MKTAQSALMRTGNILGQIHPVCVLVALQMRDVNLMDGITRIQVAGGCFSPLLPAVQEDKMTKKTKKKTSLLRKPHPPIFNGLVMEKMYFPYVC